MFTTVGRLCIVIEVYLLVAFGKVKKCVIYSGMKYPVRLMMPMYRVVVRAWVFRTHSVYSVYKGIVQQPCGMQVEYVVNKERQEAIMCKSQWLSKLGTSDICPVRVL